ncbi:BnaC01g38760D [Brassica napus]|uniref:BnaC01g38760D protein n=1 Tax=Brassica napus TaxID=3708 RepID=A0A078G6Y9_BRANA|nr:BnaC01g38760D [Brassica napus]
MATSRLQMEGDDSVLLHVTHSNLKSFAADVRFSPQGSMMKVAPRLQLLVMMQDLSVPYPIVDLDPSSVTTGGWLEDTSLVETYNISEEDYAKRTDSFRKLKEKRVSQNPAASEVKVTVIFLLIEYLCVNIKVGDRCQVEAGEKIGVVKYVGRAESLGPGYWVGIQYDEPLGKHDGMLVRILKETLYVKPEKGV